MYSYQGRKLQEVKRKASDKAPNFFTQAKKMFQEKSSVLLSINTPIQMTCEVHASLIYHEVCD